MPVHMTDEDYQALMNKLEVVDDDLHSVQQTILIHIFLLIIFIVTVIMDQFCVISLKEHFKNWFRHDRQYATQNDEAADKDSRV